MEKEKKKIRVKPQGNGGNIVLQPGSKDGNPGGTIVVEPQTGGILVRAEDGGKLKAVKTDPNGSIRLTPDNAGGNIIVEPAEPEGKLSVKDVDSPKGSKEISIDNEQAGSIHIVPNKEDKPIETEETGEANGGIRIKPNDPKGTIKIQPTNQNGGSIRIAPGQPGDPEGSIRIVPDDVPEGSLLVSPEKPNGKVKLDLNNADAEGAATLRLVPEHPSKKVIVEDNPDGGIIVKPAVPGGSIVLVPEYPVREDEGHIEVVQAEPDGKVKLVPESSDDGKIKVKKDGGKINLNTGDDAENIRLTPDSPGR